MKCPLMFAANDVFCNGRECIGINCMWYVEMTDMCGNKSNSCAVPMMVTKPDASTLVQPCPCGISKEGEVGR